MKRNEAVGGFLILGTAGWALYAFGFWPLLGLAVGAGAVIAGADGLWTSIWSRRWPAVKGEIVRSEAVGGVSPGILGWGAEVEYTYRVGKTSHRAKHFFPLSGLISGTEGWARRMTARFPAGSTVLVFHDPGSPGVSVLLPGRGALLQGSILAFGALVCAGAVFAVRDRFRGDPRLLLHAGGVGAGALVLWLLARLGSRPKGRKGRKPESGS